MNLAKSPILFTMTMVIINLGECQAMDLSAVFPAIMKYERTSMQEPSDDFSDQDEYDFIIVGSGPAGCAVANRLSEERDWEVLLLEAGGEEAPIMDIPRLSQQFVNTDASWAYRTAPSNTTFKGFEKQQVNYNTGRVMGGGSTINGMMVTRGTKYDYDNIESLGNPGWKYDDVLPFFKKVEQMEIPDLINSKYHGTDGHIKINYSPYKAYLSPNIRQAAEELGYVEVDYNGENSTGFSLVQHAMNNGSRWSASRGYLHPIRDRENLHVKKNALVRKVVIDEDSKTANGVLYTKQGKNYTVRARKEVILSAGAIKSPQLLMLSGVGPKDHLEEFGIRVIHDSKVGYNAIDHGGFFGLLFTMNTTSTIREEEIISNPKNYFDYFESHIGPLTSSWNLNMMILLDLSELPANTSGWTNMEGMFFYPPMITDENMARAFGMTREMTVDFFAPLGNTSVYQIVSFPTRPVSRGRISLKSNNIDTEPIIEPNLFSDKKDVDMAVEGIKKMIEIAETQAFQELGSKLYDRPIPACKNFTFASDEYWRCAIFEVTLPSWHMMGTCKMGPSSDESAVVDPELRVYGINGLRVIDSSIYPEMPAPHTMMPTYMVGEKGADLIKETYLK